MSFQLDVRCIESYKCVVYRRIQIAAAIFFVKITPRGKSPECYAAEVQQRLRTLWLNSSLFDSAGEPLSSRVNHHILTQHQHILSSRLFSIIPQVPLQCEDDYDFESDLEIVHRKHDYNSLQKHFEESEAIRLKLQANTNFVQAVIQLKALANSQSTVPKRQYVSCVYKLNNKRNCCSPRIRADSESLPALYNDNFASPAVVNETNSVRKDHISSVSSNVLLYTMRSYNAEQLLKKSFQAIICQLEYVTSEKSEWSVLSLDEVINQWKESIYERATGALQSVINLNTHPDNFTHGCNDFLSFIKGLILNGKKNVITNEVGYYLKENQALMAFIFSKGSNLWFECLECIMNDLKEFADSIREKILHVFETINRDYVEEESNASHDVHSCLEDLEQGFWIFRLARIFLAGAKDHLQFIHHKNDQSSVKELCEYPNSVSIAGLWRRHYKLALSKVSLQSNTVNICGLMKSCVRQWKQKLEEPFAHIMFEYPLLAATEFDCEQMLPFIPNT